MNTKLTKQNVVEIRRNTDSLTDPQWAARLGVSISAISHAKNGRHWSSVDEPARRGRVRVPGPRANAYFDDLINGVNVENHRGWAWPLRQADPYWGAMEELARFVNGISEYAEELENAELRDIEGWAERLGREFLEHAIQNPPLTAYEAGQVENRV